MYDSTKIKLKRTLKWLKYAPTGENNIQENSIDFGEPIFVDNNGNNIGNVSSSCKSYLVIGSPVENSADKKVKNAAVFKGFWDINKADNIVFYKSDKSGLLTEGNESVYADKLTVTKVNPGDVTPEGDRYYILCQPNGTGDVKRFEIQKAATAGERTEYAGIYVTHKGVMHGASWNDYAEKRYIKEELPPGTVVCEVGDGSLVKSSQRLQPCPYVITDTYGFVIGEDRDTPVAVSGRALVKMKIDERLKVSIGDCLCADEYGRASIMTREEIKEYPDRILGIVTGIPLEDKWNGVDVNNRVWIKIK